MRTIHITGSNEIIEYNDYYKPYKCTTDSIVPKMHNIGCNVYAFNEDIKFTWSNMPNVIIRDTDEYTWFRCSIELIDPKGKRTSGDYNKTVRKADNVIVSEKVDFS